MVGDRGKDQKAQRRGVLKWIYSICLKTPTNQICSTFCKREGGTSIIDKLSGGSPTPQLRSGMVVEMLLQTSALSEQRGL